MDTLAGGSRYAAFISYSHTNEREAARLHRALEGFAIPADIPRPEGFPQGRGRIAPVFRDREELSSSPDLSTAIRAALETSFALIVLCSPAAQKSRWVNEEIKLFKRLHGEGRVFAFLIDGEPIDAFPPALLKKLGADGELSDEEGEPLAADIRPGKDGWKIGTLKIAAGLLGVGLDALRQREAARERRRMMAWTGGSVAVAAGALGLAAWAILASIEAGKMRVRAEREAQTATRTAEFMIDLFEVVDPGEARGREVTAKEILDKGVKTIEEGLAEEPRVQGDLMHTMGRVYTGLGLYPEASRILAVAREKRAATAADPEDQYATENALARALFEKGDLDAAKEIYTRLVAEAEADIANGGWRVDYAVALTGMGETTLYRDTPEEAQVFFERARDLLEGHGMAESEEMAEALHGLGGSLAVARKFDAAETWYLRAISIFERATGPENYKLLICKNDLSISYYKDKRLRDAATVANDIMKSYQRILGAKHPETLIAANNLARYHFELGNLPLSDKLIDEVLKEGHQTEFHKDSYFAFPVNTMAEIALEQENIESALSGFRKALEIARGDSLRLVGPINLNLGRALCASRSIGDGLTHVQIGRAALKNHYEDENWRYGASDEFESRCRAAMGESEKARGLAKSAYERFLGQLGPEHFFTRRSKKWMESLE